MRRSEYGVRGEQEKGDTVEACAGLRSIIQADSGGSVSRRKPAALGAGVSRAAVGEPYDAAAGSGLTPGGSSGQKYPRQGELYLRALQLHAAL